MCEKYMAHGIYGYHIFARSLTRLYSIAFFCRISYFAIKAFKKEASYE
jgi:hypothetical protein